MIKWICVFCLITEATLAADARLLSSHSWHLNDENFGGLSSIHVDDQGKRFLATSDRGYFLSGTIKRNGDKITGITQQKLTQMRSKKGSALGKGRTDSEGIAVDTNGRIYVSFEVKHRILSYKNISSKAVWLPRHKNFAKLQGNSSLEALAIDQKGWLYTIPERSGVVDRPFPVYRYNGKAWDKRLKIPRRGAFLVVGADFGPDQKFYVLERDFKFPIGFATRVRRFTLTPSGFQDEEILIDTLMGNHGNLEGISVWQDDLNRIRITLIADDNFKFFQRTQLVEYVLD